MIDAAVMHPSQEQMNHAFHTCGVFSTFAFFMYVLELLALCAHTSHNEVVILM